MNFYFADINEGMGIKMRDFLGIPRTEFNAVRIMHFHKEELLKYEFKGHLSMENLTKFLHLFKKRKLKSYYRSQPIPL